MERKDSMACGARQEDACTSGLVSVAMITYNAGPYLTEQIESILAQSYQNTELVIADDGSTDGTWEMLQEFARRDKISVFRNTGERGIHGNLECALSKVRGRYVAIADQDDIWHSEKLERLLAVLPPLGAAFCDSELIDENGMSIAGTLVERLVRRRSLELDFTKLLLNNCVSGHALLFDARLVSRLVPFSAAPMYDQQIALAASLAGGVEFLGETLVLHRQHANNSANRLTLSASREPRHRVDGNRRKLALIEGNISYLLSREKALAALCAEQGVLVEKSVRHKKIEALTRIQRLLARQMRGGFQWRLFWALLSLQRDLFYLSRSRAGLRRLFSLCRL